MNRTLILLLTILLLAPTLPAQKDEEARHIDFTKELTGLDGKPIMNPSDPSKPTQKPEPATLSDVVVNALESLSDQDKGMSGDKKFELDVLARKVYRNKNCVLSIDEMKLIKDRVGQFYTPLIVGVVWRSMDPSLKDK